MSLTSALNNASSGLSVTSRAAELVAGNVANAATPGYARRDLALSTGPFGGVRVVGITRAIDPFLIADRRLAEADLARASLLSTGLSAIEIAIGEPTNAGSLADRIARFEASLTEAAAQPDVDARLASVVSAADAVTGTFASIAQSIQDVRARADNDISGMVTRLNDALGQVRDLNVEILRVGDRPETVSNLIEQRQQIVDGISEIVPIREVPRANGAIALFTTGGAVLLDGQPQEIGFSAKGIVEPWMTLADGALSGITIGGTAIDTTSARPLLGGGALQAAFDMRDRTAPAAQTALDALARDLVERFQDPALDATLTPASAGLFTDSNAAFDPANEEGLSLRLEVNTLVVPESGGDLWRLRDGLGAVAEGPLGDGSLLTASADRLRVSRSPASGPLSTQSLSFASQANAFLTSVATQRQAQDAEVAFEAARLETVLVEEAAGGVDTDDEMQKLLAIEQAYGANARVLQTLDTLMDQLLSIT